MPDESHDYQEDPVWGDVWNPEPNEWAPSAEPWPGPQGTSALVEYQEHTDLHTTQPMSESYGQPSTGTVEDARFNLLTDVKPRSPVGPPLSIIQHDVHTYETGSELFRVRQRTLNAATDSVLPIQLLEENPNRKRALIQILPSTTSGAAETAFSGGNTVQVTVPAGQTWTIQSLSYLYNADAVVGNRTPQVTVRDAAFRPVFTWQSPNNVAASATQSGTLSPGSASTSGATAVTGPFAPVTLPAGYSITVNALASDAGDTISGVVSYTLAGGGVYIGPRDSSSSAATAAWWKMVGGAPPLEVKTQQGIDCLIDPASTQAVVQIIEELQAVEAEQRVGLQ